MGIESPGATGSADLLRELIERDNYEIQPQYRKMPSLDADRATLARFTDDQGVRTALFPAMAIPLEEKQDFECPAPHVQALAAVMPTVNRMLVIGWRGADVPFLNFMKEHWPQQQPKALFVAEHHKAASDIDNRLAAHGLSGNGSLYAGGFSGLIGERTQLRALLTESG
jgi:hypothetical protein